MPHHLSILKPYSVLYQTFPELVKKYSIELFINIFFHRSIGRYLFLSSAKDGKEIKEEVDDVQVKVQGGEDVLLGTEGVLVVAAEHDLGVVDDVQREDDRANGGVANLGIAEMLKFCDLL